MSEATEQGTDTRVGPEDLYVVLSAAEFVRTVVKPAYWPPSVREVGQAEPPLAPQRPQIVCLCGSTRFWRTFQEANLRESLAGRIVLSIGGASASDDEHFGDLPADERDRIKAQLDELHLRKIDLADAVLILDVDGYIGESTARELAYAEGQGKAIRFWRDEQ